MAVADEEEEQRVAAELEHVAAVALGDVDQVVEDAGDRPDELLRAVPPRTARRSESAVNPEMSIETSDPSIRRGARRPASSLHARTSRGNVGGELAVVGNAWHGNENRL